MVFSLSPRPGSLIRAEICINDFKVPELFDRVRNGSPDDPRMEQWGLAGRTIDAASLEGSLFEIEKNLYCPEKENTE